MGRSYTPTYRIEVRQVGYSVEGLTWNVKQLGQPTPWKLAEFIDAMDAVGLSQGLPLISSANVIRQSTGEIVASYSAPMFKVG